MKDLYRAAPAVSQVLGFCRLIRGTVQIVKLLDKKGVIRLHHRDSSSACLVHYVISLGGDVRHKIISFFFLIMKKICSSSKRKTKWQDKFPLVVQVQSP